MLRQLYERSKSFYDNRLSINISIEEEKAEAIKSLKQFKGSKVHLLWDKFYPDYFEVSDRLDLSMHAQQILGSEESTVVSIIERDINDLTSIFIYTKDRANLFATIVGILDSENINFVDAKLYGMKDGHCMDLITISDGEKVSANSEKGISLCKKTS